MGTSGRIRSMAPRAERIGRVRVHRGDGIVRVRETVVVTRRADSCPAAAVVAAESLTAGIGMRDCRTGAGPG